MSWVTYFSHPTCAPCKQVRPLVEQWCAEHNTEFEYKEVDPQIADEYNIRSVPTFRYFNPVTAAPREERVGAPQILKFLKEWPV